VLWLIFAMGALPFFAALYLVKHPGLWGKPGNYGTLITPAVPVSYEVFRDPQTVQAVHSLQEIRGRWVIIHLLADEDGKQCRQVLESTRLLHPLFSKDIPRVRRLAVWSEATPPSREFLSSLARERDLYLAEVDQEFLSRLSEDILHTPLSCGQVVLMDPLGNLMMWYDAGFDPYGLYHDLKRLLRGSQIG